MHKNKDVEHALITLNDALCTWERHTGIESVLIVRDNRGFCHRSMSGKPGIPPDVSDAQLLATMRELEV
jgi:hypothetical protein